MRLKFMGLFGVAAILTRLVQLQREVNGHRDFEREQEELAQAFVHPGWDYERQGWR